MPYCPWTDSEVGEIASAALLVQIAEQGTPGFDAVRETAPQWRKAAADFNGAIDGERGPIVRKHRMALKRMSSRVHRRVDIVALASRLAANAG